VVASPAERSAPDARERMILAAERLIAERGVGVPVRDVLTAAGQRNSSAVQYHFGGREALVEAVIRHRMEAVLGRRAELLDEHDTAGRPDSVPTLVDMLARPMIEVPYRDGATHYARFLTQVRDHPVFAAARLCDDDRSIDRRVVIRLSRCLRPMSSLVRDRRLESMATAMFALLAERERAAEREGRDPGDTADVPDLVAMLAALVSVPEPA